MRGQKEVAVEYIIDQIPVELLRNPNRMNVRKIIRIMIDAYTEHMFNVLVNGGKVVIVNIGRLYPVNFRIGAKNNPFTGEQITAKTIKRIKFLPSTKIKNALRHKI